LSNCNKKKTDHFRCPPRPRFYLLRPSHVRLAHDTARDDTPESNQSRFGIAPCGGKWLSRGYVTVGHPSATTVGQFSDPLSLQLCQQCCQLFPILAVRAYFVIQRTHFVCTAPHGVITVAVWRTSPPIPFSCACRRFKCLPTAVSSQQSCWDYVFSRTALELLMAGGSNIRLYFAEHFCASRDS